MWGSVWGPTSVQNPSPIVSPSVILLSASVWYSIWCPPKTWEYNDWVLSVQNLSLDRH